MGIQNMDVIIVGGGHAGIEAALATSRLGLKTLLITKSIESIALLSCNPSMGGVGKGQLIRELDILGGEMGKAADFSTIHSNILNLSKGPAVWSSRSQVDSKIYMNYMLNTLNNENNITIIQDEVTRIILHKTGNAVYAIQTKSKNIIKCKTLIVTTGTFLKGIVHLGFMKKRAGRYCESSSEDLCRCLLELGFKLARFKTGTSPRIHKSFLNFKKFKIQPPLSPINRLSLYHKNSYLPQLPCYITKTTYKSFDFLQTLIKKGKSPLYNGQIITKGPRYCPSIEDKIVKFPKKRIHQIFLEPENVNSAEFYVNGLSTSLSPKNQNYLIKTIVGLENAKIIRYGYSIEYAFIKPTQLFPTLEAKKISGLFFAGQINGTTGYEEAGIQGLIAGVNAAKKIQMKNPILLHRYNSYGGVLINDLTEKGVLEPYRMLTSRSEYRLILREDNIIYRLLETSVNIGIHKYSLLCKLFHIKRITYNVQKFTEYCKDIKKNINIFLLNVIKRIHTQNFIYSINFSNIQMACILKKSGIQIKQYLNMLKKQIKLNKFQAQTFIKILIDLKYMGYIKNIKKEINIIKKTKTLNIPFHILAKKPNYMSKEVYDRICIHHPKTIGDAMRISGITPIAISILASIIQREKK